MGKCNIFYIFKHVNTVRTVPLINRRNVYTEETDRLSGEVRRGWTAPLVRHVDFD